YYAKWNAGYVPFEAVLRIENANDTGMTQADILGTWYAKSGSQIRVKSTYSNSGNNRKGTHNVVCVLDGVEYPVYSNSSLTQQATLNDVYATYFIYNNTGTTWTDEVNWDDVYTGGELPYSTRPVSSAGDTIINFDYMRVRNDIVFTIPNSSSGGFIDVYKLQQNGLITGSVIYSGTKPTAVGQNVSASGVSAENISWSYTAATRTGSSYNNYYTLHDMKYGQRIYEVYPVGGSWLTARSTAYHQYKVGSGQYFSSRRQDLTADFFSGSGRGLTPYSLTVEFRNQEYIALMYAIECLKGETADFVYNGVGYKVDTELCEVVKHTGYFAIKDLDGCEAGINLLGVRDGNNIYYTANTVNNYSVAIGSAKIGDTSVQTLFGETYWSYYSKFNGVQDLKTFSKIYIFYYDRMHMNLQFNFGYDSNGDGTNETVRYENIACGEKISEYQFGKPDFAQHPLLEREGYEFAGWLDSNGFVLEDDDWASLAAYGDSENNTMIFIAKWEKISNNIVEYYEDRSSPQPFESHYFDDGELVQFPTMTVYPEGWVWQEYGEGTYQRFDWDVPMYGEYGVQEIREINGEEQIVNVIRIYGTWDESHTKVIYDPNAPQGGVPGSAPTDPNEYTIWQSEVPVASRGGTSNTDPDMVFVGWQLDRNGIVFQPGDHVPVQWPRTMIFTAQWTKPENVVYLRYDPNGGTPDEMYPNSSGFPYKKDATAAIWDNTKADGKAWFSRPGDAFIGWNTEPDGSGTAYAPDSSIVLTEPVTTLYAQWRSTSFTLSVYKVDSENNARLIGAEFGLYKLTDGIYTPVQTLTTGVDGHIVFPDLETDVLYKLVEEKPPGGYAIITKEIYFALMPNGSSVKLTFYDSGGRVISTPGGVMAEYVNGSRMLTLTVSHLRGYALPSTGGSGTHIYILIGLVLVLAPFVYGFRLRRNHERRLRQ
ncbi:MAG: InlB B-repeat-containing protein, partial [Clostridia bacterium]|nr:InlB B-repeat-containing protein [Clostridia bacterium]